MQKNGIGRLAMHDFAHTMMMMMMKMMITLLVLQTATIKLLDTMLPSPIACPFCKRKPASSMFVSLVPWKSAPTRSLPLNPKP